MKAWMLVLNSGFHVLTTLKPYWAWICSFANPGKCGGAHLWLQSSSGGSRRIVAPRPVGSWSALARVRICLSQQPPPSSALVWSPLSGLNLPHRPRGKQASAPVGGNISWALRRPRASQELQSLQGWQELEEFPHYVSSCLAEPTLFCRLLQRSVRQSFTSVIRLGGGRAFSQPHPAHTHTENHSQGCRADMHCSQAPARHRPHHPCLWSPIMELLRSTHPEESTPARNILNWVVSDPQILVITKSSLTQVKKLSFAQSQQFSWINVLPLNGVYFDFVWQPWFVQDYQILAHRIW